MSKLAWNAAQPAPIVLISGKEDALADRARDLIRARLSETQLEIHDIDAAQYSAGQLLTAASPSLFGDPRLIRIESGENMNDAFQADLASYLEHPDADTTLLLRYRGGQRGRSLLQKIRAHPHALEIDCAEVKDAAKPQVVQQEFQRLSARATPGAVRQLVTAYAEDLGELLAVCGQLVRDHGNAVDERAVEVVTAGRVETTAFKIADAACAGRGADALILLRHALATGAAPHALLGGLNFRVRAIARAYGSRGTVPGMAPWQADQARRDARHWTETALAELIQIAAHTEWLLKGGSLEPEYALERYVLHIARRGRR